MSADTEGAIFSREIPMPKGKVPVPAPEPEANTKAKPEEKARRGRPPGSSRVNPKPEALKARAKETVETDRPVFKPLNFEVVGETVQTGRSPRATPSYTMIDDIGEEPDQDKAAQLFAALEEQQQSPYIHESNEGYIIFYETYLDALARLLVLLSQPQRDRLVDFMITTHKIPIE